MCRFRRNVECYIKANMQLRRLLFCVPTRSLASEGVTFPRKVLSCSTSCFDNILVYICIWLVFNKIYVQ